MINHLNVPVLEVYLFGSFEVLLQGVKLQDKLWHSRQVRMVFKALAARRGLVTTSEQLIDMLWPGDDPETALRRLYVRVSQLRSLLKGQTDFNPIQSVPGGYLFGYEAAQTRLDDSSIAAPLVWVDVDAFEAAADQGRHYLEQGDLKPAVKAFELARQLYRGDYLAEDRYVEWTIAERERLHERHLVALTELAEAYAQQGLFHRSINLCQHVLALDPWREAIFLRLMLYYYYAGDKVKALQTFNHCQQALKTHIGIDPDPHTIWMAQAIQDGTLWLQTGEAAYPPPAFEGRMFDVPYSLGDVPFTGRDRELAWMLESWRSNPQGCIWISGEAGIGKTRLVNAFIFRIKTEDVGVIHISASRAQGDLFEATLNALNLPAALAAVENLRPEARAILLQLDGRDARLRQGADFIPVEQMGDHDIADALAELMLAINRRFLLCVDDAHLLDDVSIDFLRGLIGRVGLVLTSRRDAIETEHPFSTLVKEHETFIHALRLNPWRCEDVAQMLKNLAAEEVIQIVPELFDRSQGNPLFVIASLQYLFEEGVLYVSPEGKWAQSGAFEAKLAPSIKAAIAQRLNLVQLEDRMILDVMAVAGGEIDYEVLQSVLACDENYLLGSVDRLISKGLILEPRGYQNADLTLTHGLYAEVLYETLPDARQRIFHRRIAEAMQATGRDKASHASSLADHFFRGGDARAASHYARVAGDHALGLYAPEKASSHYQDALDWMEGEACDDKADFLARVWLGMAEAQRYRGAYDQAARLYEQAIPLLDKEFKEGAIFQLFNVKILQGESLSVFDDLSEELGQFLEQQGESWALALLYWSKSFVGLICGDGLEARRQYAQGWRVARKLTNKGQQMPAWICQRALSIIMRAHNQWGHYRTSIHFAEKILAVSSQSAILANTQAVVRASLGESFFYLGDYAQAETAYQDCFQLASQAQDPRLTAIALLGLGQVQLARGSFVQAEAYAEQVLAMSAPAADLLRQMQAEFLKVCIGIKTAIEPDDQIMLENLAEFAQTMHANPYVAIAQVVLAELMLLLGKPDQAEVQASAALEIASQCWQKREVCAAQRWLGVAKARQGQLVAGRELCEEALHLAQTIQVPFEAGLCWLALAELPIPKHERANAAQNALELFTRLAATHEAQKARDLLDSLWEQAGRG